MGLFANLFRWRSMRDAPALRAQIERAVSAVEPLLRQAGGYPDRYRMPVRIALEYAGWLAASVPGPVTINRESYARDAFVHALFPDADEISVAISSSLALREYQREFPSCDVLYALMGMRRIEKNVLGMELNGQTVQREVQQQAVYFTSHTIDNPSTSEARTRELIQMCFFDSLVSKVMDRIEKRKQDKMSLMTEKDLLMMRLRTADGRDRAALEEQLTGLLNSLQAAASSLELHNYAADFESVLRHPEEYLRLDQTTIILDNMGIRRTADSTEPGKAITFSDLIGYDRRDWTVALVRLTDLQNESFADKLDLAYRKLVL